VAYPNLVRLRQQFERLRVEDVAARVRAELQTLDLGKTIRAGHTVALTAGSRGIANIPVVLRTVVHFLKELGAQPFLVPAMGSHGGGTAEGQRLVLESYGISERFVGAPIKAAMEVVSLGSTSEGFPVVLDKYASEADHIGVIARVKPHTSYHGPLESGLCKMLMIGLGKHVGALHAHKILLEYPFDQVVRSVARVVRARARIAFGLGLVENAYDETALVEAVRPEAFEPREEALLVQARHWLPRLPFHEADLLIVDEIGKEISGSGMDTNVVGRKRAFHSGAPAGQPQMRFIFVRGLSQHTHGNATGIGLADFTTTRLVRSMNYRATVINCLTSGYPDGANLPVHFDSDREVLDAALAILGTRKPEDSRILRIRNTLSLAEVTASEPCLALPRGPATFTTVGSARPMTFDAAGNLEPLACPERDKRLSAD
jgi:Lactate racemase N-terminal domain